MTAFLSRLPYPLFAGFAAMAAFSAYFAMYGFRRPFTAGTYPGEWLGTGVALKTAFVLSQLVGYTASKWIGVKVCSEATRRGRGPMLIAFIVAVMLCLAMILVGFTPITDLVGRYAGPRMVEAFASFGVLTHFDGFNRGVLDIRGVLYFLSIMVFALVVTAALIRNRRT